MSRDTHTHRGHCQLCTHVQAIEPDTGCIALHGYTVAAGYYQGICPGSNNKSLHVERTYADAAIKTARADAARLEQLISDYQNGVQAPSFVWDGTYDRVPYVNGRGMTTTREARHMVKWELATPRHQQEEVHRDIYGFSRQVKIATDYANDLEFWAERVYDKIPAYLVEDLTPRDWIVGDTVRVDGKKGYDAVIEALELRPYRTFGFSRGNENINIPHALVTRPAKPEKRTKGGVKIYDAMPEKKLWIAVRHIKRPATPILDELKKAGKI